MNAIEFQDVTKTYLISKGKYGLLTDTIGEKLRGFLKKKINNENNIVALRNVSFEIKRGESVGIIGRNGAGKTTILKLISQITFPNSGKIKVDGKIGAFIELGAGLHPELTGRENIYLYGAILGMKKKEIETKFNQIVDFAEIKKFLDLPIKKYSSGMYSRLGFAVCAFSDPDILLVDEVLAVGDVNFQQKCLVKMNDFKKENRTIVFISHNMDAIRSTCDRVIYLENGKLTKTGRTGDVVNYYLKRAQETYSSTI